jgi:hypothetical protein
MRRKFSWGAGTAIAVAIFLVGVTTLVVIALRQDVSLVQEQYYDRGQHYDDRINAIERARQLREPLAISVGLEVATVAYPRLSAPSRMSGSIVLYRPSSRSLDRTIPVSPDTIWSQSVPIAGLEPGLWRMQIAWKMNGEEYYVERELFLPVRVTPRKSTE